MLELIAVSEFYGFGNCLVFQPAGKNRNRLRDSECGRKVYPCRRYRSGEKGLNDPNDFCFLVGNSIGYFPGMFLPGFFMSGSFL